MAGGLFGGLMGGARTAGYPQRPAPMAAPIVQGAPRTREQAKAMGLIGGSAPGGFFREFGYRPDETGQNFGEWLFSSRQDVEAARQREAAKAEAARMAPLQQRMDQFTQGLPDPLWYAAQTAPADLGKQYALGAAPQKPPELMNVGPDSTVFDPVTRAPVFSNQRPDNYTLGPGDVRYSGKDVVARGPDKQPGNGINLTFGDNGGIAGLSIGGPQMPLGGDGPKGKGPAVVPGPNGEPRVALGEQALATNKSWNALRSANEKTNLVREEISRALPLVGQGTTGAWAATKDLPFVGPSTDSGRLEQVLKTIKANVGFDELQQMRENSPTGGALGQVAVQEIDFLQSVLGSLEQAQRPEDLTFVLKRLDNYMANRDERRREAFAMDYPELAQFAGFAQRTGNEVKRIQSAADYNALPRGAEYIDDQGMRRRKP